MLRNPRQMLIAAGCALLLAGAVVWWRAMHPPLTPQEQVAAQVEEIRVAIENRKPKNATQYLASDFSWGGISRKEVQEGANSLVMWRDVQLSFSGLNVRVNGDQSTATGHFSISFRQDPSAPLQRKAGDFKLLWELRDGVWQVVKAEGGENLAQ